MIRLENNRSRIERMLLSRIKEKKKKVGREVVPSIKGEEKVYLGGCPNRGSNLKWEPVSVAATASCSCKPLPSAQDYQQGMLVL